MSCCSQCNRKLRDCCAVFLKYVLFGANLLLLLATVALILSLKFYYEERFSRYDLSLAVVMPVLLFLGLILVLGDHYRLLALHGLLVLVFLGLFFERIRSRGIAPTVDGYVLFGALPLLTALLCFLTSFVLHLKEEDRKRRQLKTTKRKEVAANIERPEVEYTAIDN